MLSRAERILKAIHGELELHDRALEVDQSINKIKMEVILGSQYDPVKIIYSVEAHRGLNGNGASRPAISIDRNARSRVG